MNAVNFILTGHAETEMRRRQIDQKSVAAVMAAPEQIVEGEGGRKVYQGKVECGGKTYLVRLIVEDWHSPPVVITVYRTSKIEKYWRPQ